MMDREKEKVIKGLEKAVEVFDGRISNPMFGMWMDETKNALALLKAQEPRVMAGAKLTDAELIEEIRKAPIVLKPAVAAVPVVHGYWIHCKGKSHIWYCSNCGEKVNYNNAHKVYAKAMRPIEEVNRFCRNCGAKMDGERRDEA